MARKKKTATADDFCVYIGPSIRGLIQKGQIYIGDKDSALEKAEQAIGAVPEIRHLIVTGNRLPEARQEVRKAGTALNTMYKRVLEGK